MKNDIKEHRPDVGRRTQTVLLLICSLLFSTGSFGQTAAPAENPLYPRPVIVPVPLSVADVKRPVISLNGTWKISTDVRGEFWKNETDISAWKDVPAPAQIDIQGIQIPQGRPYAYKKRFSVPADFKGQRVFIRFEGVSGTAQVWINGHFLRSHFGGFNVWNCDITDHIKPGSDALLTVGILEHPPEGSTAGFDRGGILRNVKLMAVAPDHLYRFNVETDLDDHYKNAALKIWVGSELNKNNSAKLNFKLKDPKGRPVTLPRSSYLITRDRPEVLITIPVADPTKWDAEHPELYTLEATIFDGKTEVETLIKKIGFRQIKIDGVHMLINGKEVKLRGAGRFDSDPIYGRYLSDTECRKEVKMLKEANLNFVRPSCYPASEAYLEACDEIGLYVQLENTVTFTKSSQHDTASTKNYLSMMAEMIEAARSHSSVTIYELANETYYGINIGKTYEYATKEDPTRPIIYSWSQSVPSGVPWPYSIFSVHYPDWDSDLGKPGVSVFNSRQTRPLPKGMPILYDEFAHGASYYQAALARDPGIRDFWGYSLKKFWENMFQTDGCLGGAMWAIIDDNAAGNWAYEWGAIDLWRRERPEYWHFKKAYSPVRINDEDPFAMPDPGRPLSIPVKNWYDHTNFKELRIQWSVNGHSGMIKGPDILPHGGGTINIPASSVKKGDVVGLKFYDSYQRLVDEFNILMSPRPAATSGTAGPIPEMKEDSARLTVTGKDFEIGFDKKTGMIGSGKYKGKVIITGGPYFHLTGQHIGQWKLKKISAQAGEKDEVFITIDGSYDLVGVTFDLSIDGTGRINTEYTLNDFRVPVPIPRKIPWDNQDAGGFEEVGISYLLPHDVDRLSWERKGLWSVYPEDHIGRTKGTAFRYGKNNNRVWGQRPEGKWYQDEKDPIVFGPYDLGGRGTNDFRSTKENIYYAFARAGQIGPGVQLESNAKQAVRMQVIQDRSGWIDNTDPKIRYSGEWRPSGDTLEYFKSAEVRSTAAGDRAEYTFYGTGIAWIGTKGRTASTADVYIDDQLAAADINFANRSGAVAQATIFSKTGLPKAEHTIKIIAKNRPDPQTKQLQQNERRSRSGIPLDGFAVLDGETQQDVMMIISNKWNQTKLGLGNYMKDPIVVGSQYRDHVTFRLTDKDRADQSRR